MISPRDLLRNRQAPAPIAVPMPTEIRSGGLLLFHLLLRAPEWAGDRSPPVIAQWSCRLGDDDLMAMFQYLRAIGSVAPAAAPAGLPKAPPPDMLDQIRADTSAATGIAAEAAIDAALRKLRIGHFLGVFVDEGRRPYTVRVLIGLKPDGELYGSEADLNKKLNLLYCYADYHANTSDPRHRQFHPDVTDRDAGNIFLQASAALQRLRGFWQRGSEQQEARAMMLAQFDLASQLSAERSPFTK
jgi:hypothetical protein